jgi:hypothetical protein
MSLSVTIMLLPGFSIGEAMHKHSVLPLSCLWVAAMLSYRQDLKHPEWGFGKVSQIVAVAATCALVVRGLVYEEWLNFLVAPALIWAHIELTKRWKARPGTWW